MGRTFYGWSPKEGDCTLDPNSVLLALQSTVVNVFFFVSGLVVKIE